MELLIGIGADVNAMDHYRNTPLHLIVTYNQPINDFLTLHSIITDLTEAGAHIDIVNSNGETPMEASSTCKLFSPSKAWLLHPEIETLDYEMTGI